jgi:hypothetical protein
LKQTGAMRLPIQAAALAQYGVTVLRQRSGHALITAWQATNVLRRPALVLEGPSDLLELVRSAVADVRRGKPPACPYEEQFILEEGVATLVLGGLLGAPVGAGWPAEAGEPELLALAVQHTQLLASLHKANYAGLRPGIHETWWDPSLRLLVLLGWEWVRPLLKGEAGNREALADWAAAAALWTTLLTGCVPPRLPRLTATTDWAPWRHISLDLRRTLARLLSGEDTVSDGGAVCDELEDLLQRRKQSPTELLQKGRELLPDAPEQAAPWLDLAARMAGPGGTAETVLAGPLLAYAEEQMVKQVQRLLADAHADLLLERPSTSEAFQRAASAAWGQPALQIAAWRGWAVSDAIQTLDPDGQMASRYPGVLDALTDMLAAAGRVQRLTSESGSSAALAALDRTARLLGAGISLNPLKWLRADLVLCGFMAAAAARLEREPQHSADLYARAATEIETLPHGYREALLAWTGDPAEGQRIAAARHERILTRDTAAVAAEEALNSGVPREAEIAWTEALALCEPGEPQALLYRRGIYQAQLRANAMAAGVDSGPKALSGEDIAVALETLFALWRAFPEDEWATDQVKRWRQALLASVAENPGSEMAAFLSAYWPRDRGVTPRLRSAARTLCEGWQKETDSLQEGLSGATPAASHRIAGRARGLRAEMQGAQGWIRLTDQADAHKKQLDRLTGLTRQAQVLRKSALALRREFSQALESGQTVDGVLQRAAEAHVEIYDDPQRSVAELKKKAFASELLHSDQWEWYRLAVNAERCWRSGDLEHARSLFERLAAADAPGTKQIKAVAVASLERISQTLQPDSWVSDATDAARKAWQQAFLAALPVQPATASPEAVAAAPLLESISAPVVPEPTGQPDLPDRGVASLPAKAEPVAAPSAKPDSSPNEPVDRLDGACRYLPHDSHVVYLVGRLKQSLRDEDARMARDFLSKIKVIADPKAEECVSAAIEFLADEEQKLRIRLKAKVDSALGKPRIELSKAEQAEVDAAVRKLEPLMQPPAYRQMQKAWDSH